MAAQPLIIGKFWFSPHMPDEVLELAKELFLPLEWMIPAWCEEVRVFWDAEGFDNDRESKDNSASAYMTASYSYRFARIALCPVFLSQEDEERRLTVRHEMGHVILSPFADYVREAFDTLAGDNEIVRKLVETEIRERYEAVTEDLAKTFQRGCNAGQIA